MKNRLIGKVFGFALILTLFVIALPIADTQAVISDKQESHLPSIQEPLKGNPKLESVLNQLVDVGQTKGSAAIATFAQQRAIDLVDNRVKVVIEAMPGEVDAAREAAIALGAEVEASYEDLIRVVIPVSVLTNLANDPSVHFVRQPRKPEPQVISEGMSLINADDWQAAGYNGLGVKVGILDVGFSGYTGLLGTELPSSVTTHWFISGGTEGTDVHGAACTEIIHDIAPAADLYLTNVDDEVTFYNAVDWLIAQDVDVISCSLGWLVGGPGDGTGPICDKVADARNAGILWVNSAGNSAQRHWMGSWVDVDLDNWLDFVSPYETNSISAYYGDTIWVTLKWDDTWGLSSNDYDLYLWDSSLTQYVVSNMIQNGDDDPVEGISITAWYTGVYYIAIKRYSADGTATFHLFSWYQPLEYRVVSNSLSQPADSLAAMTVGAVPWYSPASLESFSSQGPTEDGRIKPDLVGPDSVSTATYGSSYGSLDPLLGTGFPGTSASAPHAAGAAALVKQAHPSYTPAQIQAFLEGQAVDLGAPGKDNLYGAGRLNLQLPPSVTTNSAGSITTSSVTLNGNLAAKGTASSVNLSFQYATDVYYTSHGNTYDHETNVQSKSVIGLYNSPISSLTPGTTYHFRAKAVGDGTSYGNDTTFTTTMPPSVITNAAGNITANSATLNGNLTAMGTATTVTVSFQWGTTISYVNETPGQVLNATGAFSGNITGLNPNTTYHFRAKTIGNGTSYGNDTTFKTSTLPPTVITNAAGSITTSSATLNGNLSGKGTATSVTVSFQWGNTTDYGNETPGQIKTVLGVFSSNLTGLKAGTTYHFRAKAVGNGTSYGNDTAFTTSTIPPSVVTNAAGNITASSATLNGNLTAMGTATTVTVSLQWGNTTSYGNETPAQVMTGTGAFSGNITGLNPNTTCHFRAKAIGNSTSYGNDTAFTTSPMPPTVITNAAGNITTNSATLNGNLTAKGTATSVTVSFEWGNTSAYGNTTPAQIMAAPGAFSGNITGLDPITTYHFRAKAIGNGTSYGNDTTFTTGTVPPTVITNAAGNITANSATLNGNLTAVGSATSVAVSFEWGNTISYGNETSAQVMTGPGAFSGSITGLNPYTTYHFRAKAAGNSTSYGNDTAFATTVPPVPTVRHLPSSPVSPGQTFDVSVTFTAPLDAFNSIGLVDNAPTGWTVQGNATASTPNATNVNIVGSQIQFLWMGNYTAGTVFTVPYTVTVPSEATAGSYPFSGNLTYFVRGMGPTTENIVGDLTVQVSPGTPVTGITREVNGSILPGVSITLDGAETVVSDQSGVYVIAVNSTGSHTLVAHKDGFRDRTQTINIAGLGPGYAMTCNFQGNLGLIPNAPNMQYALMCINRWLYPPGPDTGLTMLTALSVINAWLYPVH